MSPRARSNRLLLIIYVVAFVGALLPTGVRHLLEHAVRGEFDPHGHLVAHAHDNGRLHVHQAATVGGNAHPSGMLVAVGWGLRPGPESGMSSEPVAAHPHADHSLGSPDRDHHLPTPSVSPGPATVPGTIVLEGGPPGDDATTEHLPDLADRRTRPATPPPRG